MISRLAILSVGVAAAATWSGLAVLLGLTSFSTEQGEAPIANLPVAAPAKTVPAVVFRMPDAAIAELLGRSPFDEARRQFVRASLDAPAAPPPEPPKLLGVTSSDGKRSALVEWKATGEMQRLTVGMETPLGKVVRIGDSDLVLKSGETETTVSMFD